MMRDGVKIVHAGAPEETTLAGTAWERMKVSSVIPSSIGGSRSARRTM
jgi:hypothetical protein